MAQETNASNQFDSGFGSGDASTSRTTSTVVGLFRDRDDAEKAIRALHDAGFSEREIGIAMRDAAEQKDISERTGATGEGAKKGAVSGGVVGGLAGLLGALLIPGLGPIVVAGWLGSTLVGAGIGAAAGGLIGGLVDLGVSEGEAHHFEKGVQSGGILVTVNASGRAHEAYEILHDHGADLGPEVDAMRDNAGTMGSASMEHAGRQPVQAKRLQLKEEQLRVMKEREKTGDVRLRKEVVTEQRTIGVPVTREEVVIERHPVSGKRASSGDFDDDKEIRIPVSEERVRVEKTPVVREEVSVGKREVQDTQRVSDKVRHEEARIDQTGNKANSTGSNSESWRGNERRFRDDVSYSGPERRVALR